MTHDSVKNYINLVRLYLPFIDTVIFVVCTFYSKDLFSLKTFYFENGEFKYFKLSALVSHIIVNSCLFPLFSLT